MRGREALRTRAQRMPCVHLPMTLALGLGWRALVSLALWWELRSLSRHSVYTHCSGFLVAVSMCCRHGHHALLQGNPWGHSVLVVALTDLRPAYCSMMQEPIVVDPSAGMVSSTLGEDWPDWLIVLSGSFASHALLPRATARTDSTERVSASMVALAVPGGVCATPHWSGMGASGGCTYCEWQ